MKVRFLSFAILLAVGMSIPASGQQVRVACELQYRPDGKFKILQLTDTHYVSGDSRSEQTLYLYPGRKNLSSE